MTTGLLMGLLLGQARVTLVFGGDVIPHEPVKLAALAHERTVEVDGARAPVAQSGWAHVFGPLTEVFHGADLSLVNLETPVTAGSSPQRGEKTFNAGPELLLGLKRAGVSGVTFANNHCLDQKREGVASTRALAAEAGLLAVGAGATEAEAWQPLVVERNGLKVGVIAVTRWLNGYLNVKDPTQPHVPVVPYPEDRPVGSRSVDQLLELTRETAARVDVLAVVIHWGTEYSPTPLSGDKALAKALVGAGASLVVGHHPHVLQPVEVVTRPDGSFGVVAYSLGNLVSNQDALSPDGATRDGLLLAVTFERRGPAWRLRRLTPVPVFTENRPARATAPRTVQAVLLDDELSAIESRVVELGSRKDRASLDEKKALLERRVLAVGRRARILSLMPELPNDAPGSD